LIILGIDPGSRATGLGLVRCEGHRVSHLASEVIRPPAGPLASRLAHIHGRVALRLAEWKPQRVALEAVFSARNPRSALQLGQARGAALAACGEAGLHCAEYAPSQVKSAVVGTGAASKVQVQAMVQRLLALDEPLPLDASDALAVALCHGQLDCSPGAGRVAMALAADRARSGRRGRRS
jgi:crossover junction endodeoxyribonuclease RuvC